MSYSDLRMPCYPNPRQSPIDVSALYLLGQPSTPEPPYANAEAMNLHLQEVSRQVAAGAHAVRSREAIVEICCRAWNALMTMPDRIASITRREWAKPVAA